MLTCIELLLEVCEANGCDSLVQGGRRGSEDVDGIFVVEPTRGEEVFSLPKKVVECCVRERVGEARGWDRADAAHLAKLSLQK